MRHVVLLAGVAVAALLVLFVVGCEARSAFNPVAIVAASTHPAPLAPTDPRVSTNGEPAPGPHGWTNQPRLSLGAALASPAANAVLVPEVEFRPADQPFTGKPTVAGKAGTTSVTSPTLQAGRRYHWQIRGREVGGKAGPWVAFDGILGYAPHPPPAPRIAPLPRDGIVTQRRFRIAWSADVADADLAGFAAWVDQNPPGVPPERPTTAEPAATLEVAADGDWFVHVRSLDEAGNWSATATQPVRVDSVPLTVSEPFYRTFGYHPDFGTLPIAFKVSKPATVAVTILPEQGATTLRTFTPSVDQGRVKVEWDGKDANGALVAPGKYRFRVVATDKSGNVADVTYNQLSVTQKRIVVSLSEQKLWAYDGEQVALQSLVTTGGPQLPTPTGTFQILSKQSPFTFHSPWPKGSPFWYPDSPTSYAMMFDDEGFFLHDAPWRRTFGPGTNLTPGQPGEETSGTHGCVNVPLDVQAQLYAWTDLGTPVIIQP